MTTHHLLAIYSGGLVDLDGQGLSQPEDQMPGYGTGKLDRYGTGKLDRYG